MFWKVITVIIVCLGLVVSFLTTRDPVSYELKLKKTIYEEEVSKREQIISDNQDILIARKQLTIIDKSTVKLEKLVDFCMKSQRKPDLDDLKDCKSQAYQVLNLDPEYDTRRKALTELREVPPMPSIK